MSKYIGELLFVCSKGLLGANPIPSRTESQVNLTANCMLVWKKKKFRATKLVAPKSHIPNLGKLTHMPHLFYVTKILQTILSAVLALRIIQMLCRFTSFLQFNGLKGELGF